MRILELFSGFGHVSKYFKSQGYETLTLDYDKELPSDITQDILEWDYKQYEPKHFKIIWASPDCTSWSIACHKHRTQKEGLKPKTEKAVIGEKLIHKTLEIIEYFQPDIYIIENPRGRLRHFEPMKKLPHRTTVYYSNYGFNYVKPTDLWSNVKLWDEKNTTPTTGELENVRGTANRRNNRSQIPSPLIEKIYQHLHQT